VEVDDLFLDGAHFRYHPGAPAEPILVAWGVTTSGGPVLLGLAPASDEGTDPWAGFLEDLTGRGLGAPLLVITDGAPGLCSAVELAFPRSLRQRCLIHRARNVLAKVPKHAHAEVKAAFWELFDGIDAPPGDQAVAEARRRAGAFADRYQHRYPAAVACLLDTLPELTCFLRFPRRTLASDPAPQPDRADLRETRRRTKVIGRLPGERSCLSLVWAVLDRASRGWRGVTQTPAGVRLLQDLRRDLRLPSHRQPDKEVTHPSITAAA
jgi:putative transposase